MPSELVYGLQDLETWRSRSVDEVGIQNITEMVGEYINMHNAMVEEWMSAAVQIDPEWNTMPISQYELASQVDFQEVDEFGIAEPVNPYISYQIGLPLMRYELSFGDTWELNRIKTVDMLNTELLNLAQADKRNMLRACLRALFYDSSWTFKSRGEDKKFPASIPVLPLANGDSQEYPLKTLGTATADHYTAQSTQPADATDPFPAIYTRLTKFIPSRPKPRLVSFVNGTSLISGITGLADFVPVLDTRFTRQGVNTATVSDAIDGELFFGDKVLGEHAAGITIVRWDMLPENYILTIDFDQKPLGMRQSPYAPLQGLYTTQAVSNYGNEIHTRYRRKVGFGVVNRIAADIVHTGNASYAVPTGYTPKV